MLGLTLCLIAAPARADLFHWTVHNLDLNYDGTQFGATSSSLGNGGQIKFTRDQPTVGTVDLFPGFSTDQSLFTISSMVISSISGSTTGSTAQGVGTFTLTDVGGDTITGSVKGVWTKTATDPEFNGALSNVVWHNEHTDNNFDGYKLVILTYVPASVSMEFASPVPWDGSIIELTASGAPWFSSGDAWAAQVTAAGSVDAHAVAAVPLPAAVLLGFLGLSAAGLKLRKYV